MLIHEIVQTELVGILEFEFVVVGKESNQGEGFKELRGRLGILYQLLKQRSDMKSLLRVHSSHTFITDGNISLCIKYVNRLVWYAPEVIASATPTAFCRNTTVYRVSPILSTITAYIFGQNRDPHSLLLPFRIM